MSDLRKEATNLKALLAEAYNNGAKSSADEIASLRAQLAKLTAAAETVCGWDWSSNNDEDAVRDVYALQKIVAAITDEQRCICQDQHRRGHCTELGCPYNMNR